MPQVALMGGIPPLTPEMHSASIMGYQLVRDNDQMRKRGVVKGGLRKSPTRLGVFMVVPSEVARDAVLKAEA